MMGLGTVFRGQSFTAEMYFYSESGDAFVGTEAAKYTIRTPMGDLVISGFAAQSTTNSAYWSANVTIPNNAPETIGDERYTIVWSIKNAKETLRQAEHFQVKSAVDFNQIDTDLLILEKSAFTDTFAIAAGETLNSFTIRVVNEDNTELYNSGLITNVPNGVYTNDDRLVYQYGIEPDNDLAVGAGSSAFRPFLVEWKATVNGVVRTEYHFLYVVNPKVLTHIKNLRSFIDKARNAHPNPALQYRDVDLVQYIDQGLQLINILKPALTDWNIVTLPVALTLGLQQTAAYCALSAQYLAEGQAAFDFQGQSVSLSVDRTQFIDAALGRIMDFINDKLPAAKKLAIRSGAGAGVLGVNIGPSLGWTGPGYRVDRLRRLMMSGY